MLCTPYRRVTGIFVTQPAKIGSFLCALTHIMKIYVTQIT
ncbi:hypothetical protein UYSO10_0263 [Kosakonia radicincitans]|nr:hypothetical protein UYSO10_0263 [Kosakonia radicincitans]